MAALIITIIIIAIGGLSLLIMLFNGGNNTDDDIDSIMITEIEYQKRLIIYYKNETHNVYHGDSTVWYHYPSGRRCSTSTEGWLCNILQYYKMHAKYGEKIKYKP